jgi:hypothetical protein
LQGNVNVCLFDLTGRLVTPLFAGRLFSPHLALPLTQGEIRQGIYLIRVSLNNRVALTKTITLL